MVTEFHGKPFDEGTIAKLQIFELYTREWLPVFLSPTQIKYPSVHIYDFFAGPGTDIDGALGSPLRILKELRKYSGLQAWDKVRKSVHFFDKNADNIEKLRRTIDEAWQTKDVSIETRSLEFAKAFEEASPVLKSKDSAKLVFIDQFGVDQVSEQVFGELVRAPACDFLFFIASSFLHRFREHPAIKQKIKRPDDYFNVHRAVADFYRDLIPKEKEFYLAPFSIKKGSNIYGIFFGSAHPLGIDKFLQVAWKADQISGEANFDVDRTNLMPNQSVLPFDVMRPTKVAAFESALEAKLRCRAIAHEFDIVRLCFEYGVKRGHAEPVLKKLKAERVIDVDFRVPDVKRRKNPRPVVLLSNR